MWRPDASGRAADGAVGFAPPGPPDGVDGTYLLVSAWRRMAAGSGACPVVTRAFAEVCGEDTGEVLATFDAFLRALACAGRRRLRVGHPGAAGLTGDERQVVALVAAVQADHAACFHAHLRWLARSDGAVTLAIAARALGAALAAHGRRLPLALPAPPSEPGRPAALQGTAGQR